MRVHDLALSPRPSVESQPAPPTGRGAEGPRRTVDPTDAGPRGAYAGEAASCRSDHRSSAVASVGLRKATSSAPPLVVHFSVSAEDRPLMEQSKLSGYRNVFIEEPLSPANAHLAKDAEVITTFVHDAVSAEILEQLPKLQAIAQRATGYDNIDLSAASRRDVAVFNVPEYGSHTVAEFAFALLLAVTRHLEHAYERTEDGDFRVGGLMGHDLHGKNIAIIGGGGIGLCAAEIARGFGMHVVVVDPKPDPEAALRIGFRYGALEHALSQADVISLHVPLTPRTEHLIDADALSAAKDGAVLINTARGGVVDTQALIDALDAGKIAAAGLDCFEGETQLIGTKDQLADQPLIEALRARDDVILTPHVAFDSAEAIGRIMDVTAANIETARWGGVHHRVGRIPADLRRTAAGLAELGERVDAWLRDRGLGLEAKRGLGGELSAAWRAIEGGDLAELDLRLQALGERAQALGADATTLLAIQRLREPG